MEKLVTLNISGEFDKGFVVQAEVRQDGGTTKNQVILAIAGASGKLPPHPELLEQYRHWRRLYNKTEEFWPSRLTAKKDPVKSPDDLEEVKNKAFEACRKAAKLLAKNLNDWLQSPDFQPIVNLLLNHLQDSTSTRILLATENHWLRRLPWCEWKLLEDIPNAEIVLASPQFKQVKTSGNSGKKEKVKILVILGDNAGTDADEDVIKQLIPDAEFCWLKEPQRRDLDAPLWEKQWDILFFAGHGVTKNEGSLGKIKINAQDWLSIDEIKNHLKTAINNGLKLAIFNCCDGLGIAYQLAEGEDLYLPQIIVMREILPIAIAPKFLQYFLEDYTQGLSLYTSLRNSRKRLQILEKDVPCVSWLPVLCQNPAEIPLRWHDLVIPPNPYQGLSAFQEKDAALFFGREIFTNQLVKVVETKKLVAVIGASGSGKSSVVLAGLIPSLRQQENWLIANLRPESTPFENLAKALLSPVAQLETGKSEGVAEVNGDEINQLATDLQEGNRTLSDVVKSIGSPRRFLLVIDQFEEIYTYPNQKSRQFLDCLLDAVQNFSAFRLVITLRADFLGQAIEYNPFREQLDKWKPEFIGGMSRTELQAAIEEPAKKRNVYLEAGLTEHILNDVGEEQGNLPLLEFALTELWKQQENGLLTRLKYDEIGGVENALCRHAEGVYDALKEGDKERTKQIFMRLVSPGEGTEYTRQLATRAEVGEENWDLVTHLATKRLVVSNRNQTTEIETVEIVHEALIKAWPDLRKWIEENDTFLRWKKRLKVAFMEWERNENKEGYLLQGAPLGEAEGYLLERLEEISKAERVFIQLGLGLRDRNRRRTILGLTSGLLAVSIFAVGAVWQWQRAESERKIAQLRQIVAQAGLIKEQQPNESQLNILLAIEVMRRKPDLEVDQTLRKGLDLLPASTVSIFHKNLESFVLSADGRHLITTSGLRGHDLITKSIKSQEIVRVWNIESGSEVINFKPKGVGDIVFSKNGKYLARASNKNILKVWDIVTGQEVMQIKHQEKYEFISFSADGKYIAGASSKTVYIWEISNGKEVARLVHERDIGHGNEMDIEMVFVFSPDSKYIATNSYALDGEQQTAQVYEISSGKKVIQRENKEPFYKIAFSPDSKYLATFAADIAASGSFSDNTVRIDEITTGRTVVELKHINLHQNTHHGSSVVIKDMAFSPNGKYLATIDSGDGRSLTLWEVANGQTIFNLKHEGKGYKLNVKFSPDGKYLLSTDNQTTKIWDAISGKEVARIPGSLGLYNSFTSNGKYLVTADGDTAKVWKVDNIGSHFMKVSYEDFVRDLVFSSDGKYLASVGDSKTVKVWEMDKTKKISQIEQEGMTAISFSSNGQYFATASKNSVQVWQIAGNQEIIQMKPSRLVQKLIFSQNGQYIAAVSGGTRLSDSNDIQIWDVATGKEILHLEFERPVRSIAFSSDNKYIFTNVYLVNPSFKMWEINSGRTIFQIESEVNDFILHPNGHYLALAGNGGVLIWDLFNGKEIRALKIDKTSVEHITYSPDGRYIATTSKDEITQIWEIDSAKEIMKIKSTDPWLSGINFSPDGKYIGTAMKDHTARIWNISNGKEISRITHNNKVNTVAFSPNGKYIATASDDGTAFVSFWQPEDLMSEACKRLTRNLSIEEWQQYFPNESYHKTCPNLPIHTTSR